MNRSIPSLEIEVRGIGDGDDGDRSGARHDRVGDPSVGIKFVRSGFFFNQNCLSRAACVTPFHQWEDYPAEEHDPSADPAPRWQMHRRLLVPAAAGACAPAQESRHSGVMDPMPCAALNRLPLSHSSASKLINVRKQAARAVQNLTDHCGGTQQTSEPFARLRRVTARNHAE